MIDLRRQASGPDPHAGSNAGVRAGTGPLSLFTHAMTPVFGPASIVPSSFSMKRAWDVVLRIGGIVSLLAGMAAVANAAVPPHGASILNTANVSTSLGNLSSSVSVRALGRTSASMQVLSYAAGSGTAVNTFIGGSECRAPAGSAQPYTALAAPVTLSGTTLTIPGNLALSTSTSFKLGNPLFVEVNDSDQNIDPTIAEQLVVTVSSENSDSEELRLTETGSDTGLFTGYMQTAKGAALPNDCRITAQSNQTLTISYTDTWDGTDVAVSSVLVDPYGVIFDSASGSAVDGVTVTLVDAATGQPATVYGDDGISLFPATVVTGGTVNDQSGAGYVFPAGNYRFPLVAPGDYRLLITPVTGYVFPSTVDDATLQTLPGAPYVLSVASRGADFTVPMGPPVQVDVPLDPAAAVLFLTKNAGKQQVEVGEFVPYTLELTNTGAGIAAAIQINDRLPAGFRLQPNATRRDGLPAADPAISSDGRALRFTVPDLPPGTTTRVNYVAITTVTAPQGKAVNSAQAMTADGIGSNTARASVKVQLDPFSSRGRVLGRVMTGNCTATTPEGAVRLSLRSHVAGDQVLYTVHMQGNVIPVQDVQLVLNLPQAIGLIDNSVRINEQTVADPESRTDGLYLPLGNRAGDWSDVINFAVKVAPSTRGELSLLSNGLFKVLARAEFTAVGSGHMRTPVAENSFRSLPNLVWPKFAALTAELRATDRQILDDLAKYYAGQQVKSVHIVGHTDSKPIARGQHQRFKDNYELAAARAQAVADYLSKLFKLQPRQITVEGAGPDKPIADNETVEGRQLNRRVEIAIETDTDQSRDSFRVLADDSGEKSIKILGESVQNGDAGIGMDAPGVAGIKLLMEDGRYAVTDERGMYHFEGLLPGSHVLQIDGASVPETWEVFACEKNSRFAGDPNSRFVDLQGGSLWRADFYVRPKQSSNGAVGLRMTSDLENGLVRYRFQVRGNTLNYDNLRLQIDLPAGFIYQAHSALRDGASIEDPVITGETLVLNLGNRPASAWQEEISITTAAADDHTGEVYTRARLMFDTPSQQHQETPEVDNALAMESASNRRFEFQGEFRPGSSELTAADKAKLDAIVANLLDMPVKHILINALGGFRSSVKSSQDYAALGMDRIRAVAAHLSSKLALFDNQVKFTEDLSSPDSGSAKRLEIIVTVAGAETSQSLRITRGDSGFWERQVIAQARDLVPGNKPEPAVEADTRQGFLNLRSGTVIVNEFVNLRLRLDARLQAKLLVDGVEVPKEYLALSHHDRATELTTYAYLGVKLGAPGQHTLSFKGMGPFGNARFEENLSITRAGGITRMRVASTAGNIADGKQPIHAQIELLDQQGTVIPAAADLIFEGGTLEPLREGTDRWSELSADKNLIPLAADGTVRFAPVTNSGVYTARLRYQDLTLSLEIPVQPFYRDWVMVGLAEGTAGYSVAHGNMQELEQVDGSDGFYHDGRLAFYAKGQIQGKWLLTLAYDSGKDQDAVDDGLYQLIDPDKYYTLYGDSSVGGSDATSRERLYVRLEAEQYYALFGDYDTGLTVTELSRYSRSFTGLKSEFHDQRVSVTAFAAQTDQGFIRDEIPGDGTSGLYRLSHRAIVLNSDKITIEVRDRFHNETIVSSRKLSRYLDYQIDADAGTLYFKEPVFSRDEYLNPIYIIAEYEVAADGGNDLSGGVRAAMKILENKVEIGATTIHEGTTGATGDLLGTDISYHPDDDTDLRAEWATTDSLRNGTQATGEAYLAEVKRSTARYQAKVYARRQEGGFGLGQQQASEYGMQKFGIDAGYTLTPHTRLTGESWREENLVTEQQRDVFNFNSIHSLDPYTISGGFRLARDTDASGREAASDLLTGGVGRTLFAERLKLRANGELAVDDNDNADYPSRLTLGGDYRLTPAASIFLEQEFTDGADQDTNTTRIGLKATPWEDASVNTSMQNQTTENGPRTFASVGLTQKVKLSEHLLVDFGIDRSQTTRHADDQTFNSNSAPVSGPITDDFTAASLGTTYKQEAWSATGRLEGRNGKQEDKTGVILGLYRQHNTGLGIAATLKYFSSERTGAVRNTNAASRFALAYRPIASQWIVLEQLDLRHDSSASAGASQETKKAVNNVNANYLFDRRNQISVHYGIKYTLETLDARAYDSVTHMLGSEYRFDITPQWDVGVRAASLLLTTTHSIRNSLGVATGHAVSRNVWLSAGYNFQGFDDKDFRNAGYTAAGPFLKFRMSLDHLTARNVLAWWEKRPAEEQAP